MGTSRIRHRGRRVAVVSTLALAVGVCASPVEASDQRRCVSQREFRDVQVGISGGPGWRQARVADHFDIIGTQIRFSNVSGVVDTVWKYRKCSAWGPGGWYVGIMYNNYEWGDGYRRAWAKVPSRPYSLTI
jgi:hypothetical protein